MNEINKAWEILHSDKNKAVEIANNKIKTDANKKVKKAAELIILYNNFLNHKLNNILENTYDIYLFFKDYPNDKNFAISQYIISRIYNEYKDFDNAKLFAKKALDSAININDKIIIADSYKSLGIIEKNIGNYKDALQYFIKAHKIYTDLELNYTQLSILNLIARSHLLLKDFDKAIEFYNKNLELKIKLKDTLGIPYTYIDLAYVFEQINNYEKAIENYKTAINLNNNKETKSNIIANYRLACIYLTLKKFDNTDKYLFNAKLFAEKINYKKQLCRILKTISDYYKQKGNLQQSIEYFKKYHDLSIDIIREDNNINIKNIQEEFNIKKEIINDELKQAYKHIEIKNKDITDSIKYAYRIQNAILPPKYLVKRLLPDSFILYKPKDVVSGDFYFVSEFHDKIIFSAVDCTGHGVPGALVSVIGYNWLVQGVREKHVDTPGKLLSFLDEGVNDTLRQTADESGVKDSMDLAVCSIDYKTNILMYAGAYNPCYYIHKGELIEIKADKLPIGVNVDGVVDIYTDHKIQLDKGDTVYIFSDGYADQFGGPRNKKFKYRQLKEKIMEMQHLSMQEQKDFLDKTLVEWQGNEEQIDDILIMGVRI